jgi:hypothetical protein
MVALATIDPSSLKNDQAAKIRAALEDLATNDKEFAKAFGTGTNGKGAITLRVTKAKAAVRSALGA